MWQSRVEIDYSVAYSDRIAAYEALYCRTSVKGGAHMRYSCIYEARMSPIASFPGLRRFSSSVCVQYNTQKRKSVYYIERKPKN